MKIHAFGDSFVAGDQDDFCDPSHGMYFDERLDYLRYNVSFPSIIAAQSKYDLVNYAIPGSGNYPQLDKLMLAIGRNQIETDDLILFGITTPKRDRVSLREINRAVEHEFLVDHQTLTHCEFNAIFEMDLFYVFSSLSQISKKFRVISFFIFDNFLVETRNQIRSIMPIDTLLGHTFAGNTLIDVLNDSWGSDNRYPLHTNLTIPPEYRHLYTTNKHPNRSGHNKIAQWWMENVL